MSKNKKDIAIICLLILSTVFFLGGSVNLALEGYEKGSRYGLGRDSIKNGVDGALEYAAVPVGLFLGSAIGLGITISEKNSKNKANSSKSAEPEQLPQNIDLTEFVNKLKERKEITVKFILDEKTATKK